MSDVPRSSRSQSRASEQSQPTRPASTRPKSITAKPQPMGPPPAPSSGGVDDLDDFDFMSKIPSPVMSLPPAPRARSGGTQPKWKKPIFEDFMDLIPASQRVVWPSSGTPVTRPAASRDSTADDSPSPAAVDAVSKGASSKEPRVSDTMEVDDGGNEAHTTSPTAPAQLRSLLKAKSKSTGSERRESVRTQFEGAQVSLDLPGTKDNSRGTRLKRKGRAKDGLKRKGESRFVREAKTTWYYTRSQVYRTS
ncbi:hypothetical protein EDB86DRAFT_3078000 [Lactarius hatsudake]|nr:hypothetical protein EDB86DRAFT_3078000 [Lactarius hatsudake]